MTGLQVIGISLIGLSLSMILMAILHVRAEYARYDRELADSQRARLQLAEREKMRQQSRSVLDCMDKLAGRANRIIHNNRVRAQLGLYKPAKLAKVIPYRRKVIQFTRGGK